MNPRKTIEKAHYYLLIILLLNLIISLFLSTRLHVNITFAAKAMVYLTGAFLFFMTARPFKKRSIYFSLYVLSPLVIFISWIFDGLFGAILASVFLGIFYPPEQKFQDGQFIFYQQFHGPLGACCTYDIVENKFGVLQNKKAEFRITEDHNFSRSQFVVRQDTGYLTLGIVSYTGAHKPARQVDSTFVIELK